MLIKSSFNNVIIRKIIDSIVIVLEAMIRDNPLGNLSVKLGVFFVKHHK